MKKIYLCKCGHELEKDHKKDTKILGFKTKSLTYCKSCCCHRYVPRSYPDRFTSISVYLVIGILAFILACVAFFVYSAGQHYSELLVSDPDGLLKKPFLTYHTVFKWMPILGALFGCWIFNMGLGWFSDYRYMKNTETKPTQSQEGPRTRIPDDILGEV